MPRSIKTYSPAETRARLQDQPGWRLEDDGRVHRAFTLKNFGQVMLLANAIAHLAEAADHHPDLRIHAYKNLEVSVKTHDPDGITDLDFALIRQIDALPLYAEEKASPEG